jgi:hypothetical protein
MGRIVALAAFMVLATAANSFAIVQAPELDSNTALTAITLLSGSVAVLRARLKR